VRGAQRSRMETVIFGSRAARARFDLFFAETRA
jgi:hypothetical protein